MIAVLQRVSRAAVRVGGEVTGEIGVGLLVLLGVRKGDGEQDAALLATKIARCRIFTDEADKMNLSVNDMEGGVLVVSNFTLLADYHHGNRPAYFDAAPPEEADRLYRYFVKEISTQVPRVATGVFGADMRIAMEADGPVTIVMDSEVLKKGRRKEHEAAH
ncbi:MAG: D-tyrosyl-tRNA(Tyr) deacylase [Ruminococcaceae bacterium]|nr:D-tyrosyl-tRNA(Tyr) deacylase [Oscillospiraceae bacterium]